MSPDQQFTDDAVLVREAKDGNPKAGAEVFRRLAAGDRGSELLTFPRWYFRAAREHERLIEKAEGGGADAARAAEKLLSAFIGGNRGPQLTDYIARCLREYRRAGVPIELALHLSTFMPPVVLGPAGEADRRGADRPKRYNRKRLKGRRKVAAPMPAPTKS
jgi:hypothetical protein